MKLDCTIHCHFSCPILTCGKSAERLGNTAGSRRQLAVLRLLKAVDKWVLRVAEVPKFFGVVKDIAHSAQHTTSKTYILLVMCSDS